MLDTHVKFHSVNGKRRILVVDDEAINRAILGEMLAEQYDVLYAETGAQALAAASEQQQTISLVLLDLILPDMNGLEVLKQLRRDAQLSRIPVIVMTSDREAEAECLAQGATDFISKPYPLPRVVLARVLRTIELFEDRDIIRTTERDHLTGLYNREFFYRYVEQMDAYHRDTPTDAMVVDISHFHMINERYGRAYGDQILRHVAARLESEVAEDGGIACRQDGDTFLLYCPHRTDYVDIMENALEGLGGRVRLRMGVYAEVDKTLDAERRFDRAKMAADTVRNSFTRMVAIYDNALRESELFAEQLLEVFPKALKENQFKIFYQPKYSIRQEQPVLSGMEALVRWIHPSLGTVSPGVFIPLFESNGLVRQLDGYVWETAAAQIRDWKDRLGVSVPVSVNVSRVDMFDSDLVETMVSLIRRYDLKPEEFLLEITESVYTQDSEQIIRTVNRLKDAGFLIEMDDFGTGYSSLNMIATLPVDALKLDMQFVRNAFKGTRNTRMLELVIDIAESLGVPTVAEGVETAEQMLMLKSMGCDVVQGYYFCKPVPPEQFEQLLLSAAPPAAPSLEQLRAAQRRQARDEDRPIYDALHDQQTGLYNHSAFEMMLQDADVAHSALMLITIDDFAALRTTQGQTGLDRIIERVAGVIRANFRSVDNVCRISEDEFAVLMSRVTGAMTQTVVDKLELVNSLLREPLEGVPVASVSAGVAFGDRKNPQGDIFHDADLALNRLREAKENGCAVYGQGE